MSNSKPHPQATDKEANSPTFGIQRIYLKDLSFEAPHTPEIFRGEWQPHVNIEMQTRSAKVEDGIYEVIMQVTATAKVGEKVAFLVETQLAGLFLINHFPEDQLDPIL
ncbi:MAG: protein-export chaperone SecB, partial [Pseudomonadota bacterium]